MTGYTLKDLTPNYSELTVPPVMVQLRWVPKILCHYSVEHPHPSLTLNPKQSLKTSSDTPDMGSNDDIEIAGKKECDTVTPDCPISTGTGGMDMQEVLQNFAMLVSPTSYILTGSEFCYE